MSCLSLSQVIDSFENERSSFSKPAVKQCKLWTAPSKDTKHREFLGDQKIKHRSKRSEHNSIVQEFAVEAIRCGADMIKVVYDEGYEEVYIRKDNMDLAPDSKAAKAICSEENSTAWRKRSDDGGRQRGIRVARMHL